MKLINQLKFLSIIFFTNLFLFSYPFVKSSFAQNKSPFEGLYIEGQVNYTQVQDIDLKNFTGTISNGRTFENLKGKLGYDSDIGYGVEVGVSEFLNKNFRLGLSYGANKIELKKATNVSGATTITVGEDTTTIDPIGSSVTPQQIRDFGLNFNSNVKIYSLNAYYDFNNFNSFVPFVGVGLGQADILNGKDKEFSKSLYLGARYLVDKNIYVGGKGTYSMIDGPEDKNGMKYDDISLYAVTLSVGYQF
jgi:opacity protein-like surface antigen